MFFFSEKKKKHRLTKKTRFAAGYSIPFSMSPLGEKKNIRKKRNIRHHMGLMQIWVLNSSQQIQKCHWVTHSMAWCSMLQLMIWGLKKNVDLNLGLYTSILKNPHKKLDMVIVVVPLFLLWVNPTVGFLVSNSIYGHGIFMSLDTCDAEECIQHEPTMISCLVNVSPHRNHFIYTLLFTRVETLIV